MTLAVLLSLLRHLGDRVRIWCGQLETIDFSCFLQWVVSV